MDPAGPVPCAAVQGTTLVVEDLFYNMLTRKKVPALRAYMMSVRAGVAMSNGTDPWMASEWRACLVVSRVLNGEGCISGT